MLRHFTQMWESQNTKLKARHKHEAARETYTTGLSLLSAGLWRAAIQHFDQAINHDSRQADVYFHRGLAYEHLGQYDRAMRDYSEAALLHPYYEK